MSWTDSRQSMGGRPSMGARPSMGPRPSMGGRGHQPAQPVQAFSFPLLKTPDILQCMHELQVRLTEGEINEADKHRDAIRRAYEQLVEICTGTFRLILPSAQPTPPTLPTTTCHAGITKDEMSQPAFSGINALNYPELHEESIPELAFFRACTKMMTVCGVHDFSMKDLLQPDPKRVRRHLSAIINFAKFREERLVMYSELAVKRDQLLDTLKRLQDEEAGVAKELAAMQEQTASEAAEMESLEKGCEVAEDELEELNRKQAEIRAQGGELKKQSQELKESLAKATETLELATEERERTRGQIVRSPARVRKELASAGKEVEVEKKEGLAAERDAREMNLRVQAVQKGEKEVAKALKSIEEIDAELAKQKLATKELKDATKNVQGNRQKATEATVEIENLKRQASRFEERLAHLRRSAKSKDEAIEQAANEAQAELLAVEKVRRTHQTAVEESDKEVGRVAQTLEAEKGENAARRTEMTSALKTLGETVAEHQQRLREALGDTTNAPLPSVAASTPILSRLSMATSGRASSIAAAMKTESGMLGSSSSSSSSQKPVL